MATTRTRSSSSLRENAEVLQAKKISAPATRGERVNRAALGDIGNKKQNKLMTKELKKSTSSLPVAVPKLKQSLPKIEVMDAEDADEKMNKTVEMLSEISIPDGVGDIDAQDSENPQLCAEYAPAMYAYLRTLEEGLVIKKDFLKGCCVNGKMRGVLIDWLIEVHTQFKLLQETLYMTVYIIDKYLQVEGLTIRRNKLQLLGVSAMFIASKVEEMYAPEINDFVYITDNAYSAAEIRQMELKILNTLNFNMSRPLPLHFLRRNSKAGDVDVLQHTVAKYMVELSLLEYDLAHYPPSLMAAASLYLSLRILEPNATLANVWTPTLQYYSTYTTRDLLPVVVKVAQAILKAKDSKLQAVHTKYMSKKFMKVGELADLHGDVMMKLSKKDLEGL